MLAGSDEAPPTLKPARIYQIGKESNKQFSYNSYYIPLNNKRF